VINPLKNKYRPRKKLRKWSGVGSKDIVGIVGDEGSKDEGDDDHNEGEGVDDQQVEVSRLQMLQLPH